MAENTNDLTIVFYTANKIPERFARTVREQLLSAIGDLPVICVSQRPMDFGENICIGGIGASVANLYRQVWIGAQNAKTPYVALCEDDALYTPGHFTCYRPQGDIFGYNHNRWGLFTWHRDPFFNYRDRSVLSQLIAPTQLLIRAMTERFSSGLSDKQLEKMLHEPGRYEGRFGFTVRKRESFRSLEPNVVFSHLDALDQRLLGSRKRMGYPRIKELPPWGTAEDVLCKYLGRDEWMRQVKD